MCGRNCDNTGADQSADPRKRTESVECVISYNDTTKEYTAQIRQGDVEVSNRYWEKNLLI